MNKIVIGMGGGYDIVIAGMIREKIKRTQESSQIDIGGFLNPKFIHFYKNLNEEFCVEKSVNYINNNVEKYKRKSKEMQYSYYLQNERKIHFVDRLLASEITGNVYDFSLVNNNEVTRYLKENYEEIIFCDVGGDILFFGEKDNMVKTPIIDAYAIHIAHDLHMRYQKKVTILLLGIGLDGELPYKNIKENITMLIEKVAFKKICNIEYEDISWLEHIYEKVKCNQKGKTNQLLIDIWRNHISDLELFAKRNILTFQEWFNQGYQIDIGVLYEFNPIAKGNTYEDMKLIAQRHGIKMERYS